MADASIAPTQPQPSLFDRVITLTPVVLTVIATIFAGLSSSEMNLAMYWRSVAAQDQSKVTSQWDLAGFKRDRSLIMQTQSRTLAALTDFASQDLPPPKPEWREAFDWLAGKGPPAPELPRTPPSLEAVQQALRERRSEDEVRLLAASVSRQSVDDAIRATESAADAFDQVIQKSFQAADQYEASFAEPNKGRTLRIQADRAGIEQRRYSLEARINQAIGYLYEVRVVLASAESDRHRLKSKNFFYVMLMAQAGVTVASVALAQRQKSLFWVFASIAGVIALLFGVYIYLAI